ncbi:probable mitochondrial import inner membrane translocase subunit TIM21 isoform X1 [Ipomoea triloba]|uniref:probable mitochondrial import inner membrane translocase subunit TIM21 isoform X1 n=1 Tax=Ipomoea triloba TaxID=35885 RepID=UPI00125D3837|nr:probable mitochondrial import inner membrane translocase subunit TIM21 isoform X1 [Ipomoea triloba]
MLQTVRRSRFSMNRFICALKSHKNSNAFFENAPAKSVSDVGICGFSSLVSENAAANPFVRRELAESAYASKSSIPANPIARVTNKGDGLPLLFRDRPNMKHVTTFQAPFQVANINGIKFKMPCFARTFASKASESTGQKRSEGRKEISTVDDPFDAPTYNIPEKPVSFTEGASYSVVILAGLGVAAAAAYAVFKELIFEPKEYKIFGKALDRIQHDSQVRVRIGSPITGYGSESRNRAARQRIPNRIWTDEDGVEHVEVNFYIRGPHGAGKVFAEMFQDKEEKQWKFTYLIVQINSPSPAQLMLESYVPA